MYLQPSALTTDLQALVWKSELHVAFFVKFFNREFNIYHQHECRAR